MKNLLESNISNITIIKQFKNESTFSLSKNSFKIKNNDSFKIQNNEKEEFKFNELKNFNLLENPIYNVNNRVFQNKQIKINNNLVKDYKETENNLIKNLNRDFDSDDENLKKKCFFTKKIKKKNDFIFFEKKKLKFISNIKEVNINLLLKENDKTIYKCHICNKIFNSKEAKGGHLGKAHKIKFK